MKITPKLATKIGNTVSSPILTSSATLVKEATVVAWCQLITNASPRSVCFVYFV